MSYDIPKDHHGPTPAERAEASRNIPGKARARLNRRDFFAELAEANVQRAPDFHAGGLMDWSPAERGNELAGETGELCNELKKLLRFDRSKGVFMPEPGTAMYETGGFCYGGTDGAERDAIIARIRNELGDVVICASLIAAMFRIDLEGATRQKFNATSAKIGSKVLL